MIKFKLLVSDQQELKKGSKRPFHEDRISEKNKYLYDKGRIIMSQPTLFLNIYKM